MRYEAVRMMIKMSVVAVLVPIGTTDIPKALSTVVAAICDMMNGRIEMTTS